MHGYPIYATWAGGPTDDRLLAFLTEITRWLAGGAAVLFSEFGLPTVPAEQDGQASPPMLVTETAAAAYTDRALNGLHAAGATGAMLWCANDYGPELWRDPPFDVAHHERHFGLWRSDRSPKAALAAVARHRGLMVLEPAAPTWIDIEPAEFYTPSGSHLARLYGRYGAAKHGEPRRPQPGG